MSIATTVIEKQIKEFCAQISADPLLVQGSGGNVSWKEGEVLWVKASGTWLAHAENQKIFVPVDLAHLRAEIATKNFSTTPRVLIDASLKPSIETLLHALMPHKIVVHLHAVEVLAHLVRANPLESFEKLVGDSFKWVFIDYIKPGAELAQAVSTQLALHCDTDVVFLKNHGLVVGGDSIQRIEMALDKLILQLKSKPRQFKNEYSNEEFNTDFLIGLYALSGDSHVNQLATNAELISRVKKDWALYPDHIVFLGEGAVIANDVSELVSLVNCSARPNFIFVNGKGVYETPQTTSAHRAQLRCYYDVLARNLESQKLASLSALQIAELLNWDSEIYRQSLFSK